MTTPSPSASMQTHSEVSPQHGVLLRACSLAERVEYLAHQPASPPAHGFHARQWQEKREFADVATLSRRAAAFGMTSAQFLALVSAGAPASVQTPPAWATAFTELFAAYREADDGMRGAVPGGLLVASRPFAQHAFRQLRTRLAGIAWPSGLTVTTDIVELHAAQSLFERFAPRLLQTLVLELNVHRRQGTLPGDTTEARYASFVALMQEPAALEAVFEEYPVLARELTVASEQWADHVAECLGRLAADWTAICALHEWSSSEATLSGIALGAGDSHRSGRSVVILEFSNGEKLVYKPRSCAVDARFHALLEMLACPTVPDLRTVAMVERATHCWCEFIAAHDCADDAALGRYYTRMGELLAVLHTLDATDFHLENLIAAGEWPVLVDLETLFHPRVTRFDDSVTPDVMGWTAMDQSVIRVGMLPRRVLGSQSDDGIEMSGLAGSAGQLVPDKLLAFDRHATDEMHAVRRQTRTHGADNVPSVGGTPANALDYVEELLGGFRTMYRRIVDCRPEICRENGPLDAFGPVETRVVIRNTRQYSMVLRESFHPDLLRDARSRDRHFDSLWGNTWMAERLGPIIPAEQRDLWRGDVPSFYTRPDSASIFDADGNEFPAFLDATALSNVRGKLAEMGEPDLERQEWIIRASMTCLNAPARLPDAPRTASPRVPSCTRDAAQNSGNRLLDAANGIARQLTSDMYDGRRGVSWITLSPAADGSWAVQPAGVELYGGVSGIGLFYLYAGRALESARFAGIGRRIADSLCAVIEEDSSGKWQGGSNIGVFTGRAGFVYTLAHAAAVTGESRYAEVAEAELARILAMVEADPTLDIIGGTAGVVMAAASLAAVRPSSVTMEAARRGAEHLMTRATPQDVGVAWVSPLPARQPLCGVSHGAGGIALALSVASRLAGNHSYRQTADAGCAYEDAQYDRALDSWPDYRLLPEAGTLHEPSIMCAWCHGAAGILAARVRMLGVAERPSYRDVIRRALSATVAHGHLRNDSLCHGTVGNLLCAHEAREFWSPEQDALISAWRVRVVDGILERGIVGGDPSGIRVPGLMMGLAGVGLALLRMIDAGLAPCVLTLDAPLRA